VNLTHEDLEREAAATGFPAETLEKAIRILSVLDTLRSHPFLKPRIALKGGTALNLYLCDIPRLSVDIDLNYIGPVEREAMLAERPKVEQAVMAVCGREGLTVRRVPSEHAGGKWRLTYTGASGRRGNLELDVNFLLRTPLWPTVLSDSRSLGSFKATQTPLLDHHEIAAGKLAALLSRTASRDIFDVRELLRRESLDRTKLRLAFVVYGGINRKDWRTVSVGDVNVDPTELGNQLLPTLRSNALPGPKEAAGWARRLMTECRELLSVVLPLTSEESEFIGCLNDRGEIVPELLTGDSEMQSALRRHPALRWKAMNVRKQRSPAGVED